MNRTGVILYGPPASGKDTITEALHGIEPRCVAFRRLKVTADAAGVRTYRPVTADELARLRSAGLVVYENTRYGNIYVVDRPGLDAVFERGLVPVVHLGQLAGVRAVRAYPAAWLPVLLWCPQAVAERRLWQRGSPDVADRLTAWRETEHDLRLADDDEFALRIDTDRHGPEASARLVARALRGAHRARPTPPAARS